MSNVDDNPLLKIFKVDKKGKCSNEIEKLENISLLWKYLEDDNKPQESKKQIINEFTEILKANRYICEFFSIIEDIEKVSIYIFFFKLYLKKDSKQQLKDSILNLLKELIINIEITKEIYEFIFQKISYLYREKEEITAQKLTEYLTLLNTIVGDTINCQKPYNYFACPGNNLFELNLSNKKIGIGKSLTININFKISNSSLNKEDNNEENLVSLLKIIFSNNQSFSLDLKYPMFLMAKEIHNNYIRTLPNDEWVNLIFTIVNGDKLYIFVNGENNLSPYKFPIQLKATDTIDSIIFFDKFKGEVSSMTMLVQSNDDKDKPNSLNNIFLLGMKNFQQGIWKRKIFDNFIKFLKNINQKDISKDLVFIFTPFNYSNENPNKIENALDDSLQLNFSGSLLNHRYTCYQKKLENLGVIQNFPPIADFFLLYPQSLSPNNFALFFKIIINIINFRKKNMITVKECKLFQILSLFIEKYPKELFDDNILELFIQIGKAIFSMNNESLCKSYFKHIFFNEKILSKYSENLQIIFWNKVFLFCQSDKEQIEKFIQMNRICLILRYYDKNKYTEMCCEKHLSMIKDEFIGSKTVMNPTMNKKLLNLENFLNVIIASQEPKSVISLFKLLTLDLSPCLTKFILNIFINALEKETKDNTWKTELINELINNNYETILINAFVHNLPDIRYDILTLAYFIHLRMVLSNNDGCFEKFERMIKTCLLSQNMFYATKKESKSYLREIEIQKEKLKATIDIKSTKRGSTFTPNNIDVLLQKKPSVLPETIISESESESESKSGDEKSHSSENENKEKGKKKEEEKKKENQKEEENKKEEPLNDIEEDPDDAIISRTFSINIKNKKENRKVLEKKDKNDNKNIIENKEENNNGLKNMLEDEKIIIIKDEYYKEYYQKLFDILLLWLVGEKTNSTMNYIDINQKNIKNPNILKILFFFEKELKDITFTNNLLKTVYGILLGSKNASILLDKIIISSFLDLSFRCYILKNDSSYKSIYDLCKDILLQIYISSLTSEEQTKNKLPCYELEIMFIWADKIITENNTKLNHLYNFIYEFLYLFLEKYNLKYEKQMNFILNDADFDISNYYLRNYLIMQTHFFNFAFHFSWDLKDVQLFNEKNANFESILGKYFNSIKFNNSKDNSISYIWPDYVFFYDIYKRISPTWKLKNIYEKFGVYENKKNKKHKYEEVLNKIILDKSHKNLFKTHFELLCYKEDKDGIEIITPLIKTLSLSLMNLVLMANKFKNENEYLYWLKEYKNFIVFIIIASCNLIRDNQNDSYHNIQAKCMGPIVASICFLHYLSKNMDNYKEKATKYLNSIMLFSFILLEYEYNYITKHKSGIKLLSFSVKPLKNDLRMSAIFSIFNEFLKNKNDNVIVNFEYLEEIKQNNLYLELYKILDNDKELNEALYDNKNITDKIFTSYFTILSYTKIISSRIFQMPLLKDELDYEYVDEIMRLLPLYEKELMKYSNNSLEKNIKKRNRYKIIKKKSFSWNGFWCDKKLFFENVDVLKLKMKNHLTKSLMKPLLVPILDIDYYLPHFSGFNKKDLFNKSNENYTKLIMDIDKILKLKERNQIIMNNVRESFGEIKPIAKENYLRSIYIKSNKKLSEKLEVISNNLDFGKEEEFTILENDTNNNNDKKQMFFLSCLVKTSHHIKGVCFIDDNKLNFKVFLNQKTGNAMNGVELAFTNEDEDYDQDRHTCFGSYLICHHKDKDLYKISIDYNDIKWIFRRRYYYKNSALEIYTTTNKSYYFNFKYEKDREIVINEIISKFKSYTKIKDDLKDPKDIFDNIIGYYNTVKNKVKLSKLISKWKEWKLNNFEMLMWLNIFGNRSYNDISQYPVFPWILSSYEDPLKSNKIIKKRQNEDKNDNENEEENVDNIMDYYYRDLSLPMGMIEINDEGARKELFLETFETLKTDNEEIKPYIYGSNYSNPVYVCNYLMRIFPFTHISIELQGNKFDDPNRLFFSVKQSFFNSTTQKTDVRELIPEFFYFPEIFLNINELNMGTRDDGVTVNDVITPCNENPYEFIFTMKKILESNQISATIPKWIDLIFGSKARGKEAELAKNVFTESSYQENINFKNVENKESYLRLVEFGLIPTQTMNKDCTKREKKEEVIKGKEITDSNGKFSLEKCLLNKETSDINNIITEKENVFILKIGYFSNDKITMLLSNNLFIEKKINYNTSENRYVAELINKNILDKKYNYMKMIYKSDLIDKVICFCNHGKDLIIGGFYDGKLLLTNNSQKSKNEVMEIIEIIPFIDEKPILSVEIDKEEKFLFVGNSIGNVLVYNKNVSENNNENKNNIWQKYCLLTEQKTRISHINCNNELNMWASISNNGYICLYTLPLCNLIRCIKAPTKLYSYVFLSDSPLPCVIAISDEDNSEIRVYSINGKSIYNKQEYSRIISPLIIKDLHSNDHLAFIGNNNIIIMSIPNLEVEITIDNLMGINSFSISEDKKLLFALDKIGKQSFVVKEDNTKKKNKNP